MAGARAVRMGASMVEIEWVANPFRGDEFEAAWTPTAEAALRYGAHGFAFLRSKEDLNKFTQLAFFDTKLDFERYWYSEEVASARAVASGMYQVPVLPVWHGVVASGSFEEAEAQA